MNNTVFHTSSIRGLQILTPKKGTHNKPYVYATIDPVLSLCFLVNRQKNFGDFTLGIGRERNGTISICERHPNAFTDSYTGSSGSFYTLPADTFLKNQTSWPEEVVSLTAVVPITEDPIDDMAAVLSQKVKEGLISLYRYPDRPPGVPGDDEDLIFKAVIWSKGKVDAPVFNQLANLHPKLHETANEILGDQNRRLEHLMKWCELFGCQYTLGMHQDVFPQDREKISLLGQSRVDTLRS